MPVVECPIAGCAYKTDDLDEALVAALIEAHCVNHASPKPTAATNSDESNIFLKLPLKKITIEDLRNDPEVRGNLIGFILCTLAFFLDVVLSFSLPHWYHREVKSDNYKLTSSVGLWKACIKIFDYYSNVYIESTCVNHNEAEFLKEYIIVGGAQGFQCLGIILIAVAIFTTFLMLFVWRSTQVLAVLGATHAFWAGVSFFGSVGSVSNGLKKTPHVTSRDFGFAFAGISGAVAVVGSLILIVTACRKTSKYEKPKRNVKTENESNDYNRMEGKYLRQDLMAASTAKKEQRSESET